MSTATIIALSVTIPIAALTLLAASLALCWRYRRGRRGMPAVDAKLHDSSHSSKHSPSQSLVCTWSSAAAAHRGCTVCVPLLCVPDMVDCVCINDVMSMHV